VCFLADSDDIDPHDLFYEGFPNYSEMNSELLVESVIMEAEDQLPATNDHFDAYASELIELWTNCGDI
jgi:hypothetical protein